MNEADKILAEAVLNRLMKNSSVTGLRFFTPQLLLDGPKHIKQECFIKLSSNWKIFESFPNEFPEELDDITPQKEELNIHSLRGEEVEKVRILYPWPYLLIHFKSGKVLYLIGKDEQYEAWTAGLTNFGKTSDNCLVIACPGGELTVWTPENNEQV
jgi:hypothetical protein